MFNATNPRLRVFGVAGVENGGNGPSTLFRSK